MESQSEATPQKFLKRKDSVSLPSYFNESTFALENLKEILALAPESRSEGQINALMAFSKSIKFFGELRKNINESAHAQCCRHLTYVCHPAGSVSDRQYVFQEGDPASRFYIILSGSCAVISSSIKPGAKPGSKAKPQLLTILRQGDCFGEIALISNKPRLASLVCRENCHFAVLERDDYKQILWKVQNKQLYDKVELLMRHPAFAVWKKDAVQRLSYFFKTRSVRQTQTLYIAGQPVNEVFLIKDGLFRLTKTVISPSLGKPKKKQARKQVHVATIGPGELLGASQSLEGNAFECTCQCVSERGEALLITKQHFKAILAGEGKLKAFLTVEKERERLRAELAEVEAPIKEPKGEIPAISEELYRHLTEKSQPTGDKPIIYHPRRILEEMHPGPLLKAPKFLPNIHWRSDSLPILDTSLPEIETRGLQVNASELSDDHSATALNSTSPEPKSQRKNSLFQYKKWRDMIFNPKKPKLITDGVDLYRYPSLPRLEAKTNP